MRCTTVERVLAVAMVVTAAAMVGCGSAAPARPDLSAERADAGGAMTPTAAPVAARAVRGAARAPAVTGTRARRSAGPRDFDGDGRADLVVGVPGANAGAGRVLVLAGEGFARVVGRVEGADPGAGLGRAVAFAGDVNGDGFGDVVVGAPGADGGRGGAWWIAGGPRAGGGTVSPAGGALRASVGEGARFGACVAGVGDVNGDGFDDVAVGAPGAGRVEVFFGGRAGPGGTAGAGITLWGREGAGSRFGASLAGAGDADGDGFDDVVVGAPGGHGAVGRVGLFLGGAAGTETTPAVWLSGPDGRGGEFGAAVALGDLDGDGFADLAAGAPGAHGGVGRVRVYFGGRYGVDTEPGVVLDGPNLMDPDFGRALAVVPAGSDGAADGDGGAGLLVGAPGAFDADGWAGLYTVGSARAAGDPVRSWGNRDGVARGMGGAVAAGVLALPGGAGGEEPAVVVAGDARAEVYPVGWTSAQAAGAVAVSSGEGPLAVAVAGAVR